jgi:hypothetical protein
MQSPSNTPLRKRNENHHRDSRRENVLTPLHWPEAISTSDAADLAKRAVTTIRSWVYTHDLGRQVGTNTLYLSKPLLIAFLENDREAMRLYHQGKRTTPRVAQYFGRCGIDPLAVFGEDK